MDAQENISQVNNSRIAKNTVMLYFRTLFVLLISLYTSRVILAQLGVDDYGIYNVVGGVVGMFSIISSALSSAISRFITFELGKGDLSKLRKIFSTSVNIQMGIAIIVLVLGEIIGVWFLNCKMSIPPGRMTAANWVLQCSLLSFCIGVISVPYNACIIAHEKMSAFAYISILEACLKLAVCYMLGIASADKLSTYTVLMLAVAVIIRLTYGIYCRGHFEESKYQRVFDKDILKEMMGFAGWNFVTNTAWVFNNQGVNILVNVFFGIAFNTARGIASQVEGLLCQFVTSFSTAINPQITKSYANNEKQELFKLMCRGTKYFYLLYFILGLPLFMEVEFFLSIWLVDVPANSALFSRLAILCSIMSLLTHPFYYGCMATGKIKKYVISVTSVGFIVFPLSWIFFAIGLPAYWSYIAFVVTYIGVNIMCVLNAKWLLGFPVSMFVSNVIKPIMIVSVVGCLLPLILSRVNFSSELLKSITIIIISILSAGLSAFIFGMENCERKKVRSFINKV